MVHIIQFYLNAVIHFLLEIDRRMAHQMCTAKKSENYT
jgi:hypothetical protein